MISLAYILMRKTIDIFLPDYLPTLKWIAYIEFVQTQNQYTVHTVNNQTNLKSVWTMMLFFFFCSAQNKKWTAVRGPLAVPTTSTPSLALVKYPDSWGFYWLTCVFFLFFKFGVFHFLSPSLSELLTFLLIEYCSLRDHFHITPDEVKSGGEWRHTGQRSPDRYVHISFKS